MRTKYEVGGIIRDYGDGFYGKYKAVPGVRKAFSAMAACRTAALGGHIDVCPECGGIHISYNSCRDRHCPKCQNKEREQWIEARKEEVMPVKYFHVVFTVPACLNSVAMANQRMFYSSMFRAAWRTLDKFFRAKGLQGGMTAILHTWGSNMSYHPHLHCIVPGGGMGPKGVWHDLDGCKGARQFLFPVQALSPMFRAKLVAMLTKGLKAVGKEIPPGIRKKAFDNAWSVHGKPPAKGVGMVLEYIGRYAYRVAISNSRILNVSPEGMVTYDYKDYRHGAVHKTMTVSAADFLHLLSMHILPSAFVRIRHYGILAPCNREKIRSVQRQLGASTILPERRKKKGWLQICAERRWSVMKCPCCGHDLIIIGTIMPRSPPANPIAAVKQHIR